ncbi:MAG: DUF2911 domain-containing protein [Gemmatimonadota bacterium]
MSAPAGPARRRPVTALLGAVLTYGCSGSPPQRVYVEELGTDTTAVEAITRTETGFEGWRVTRSPVTRMAHYRASLGPEGTVSRLEVEWSTPPENPKGPGPLRWTVEVEGDSATSIRSSENGVDTVRVAAPPGTVPTISLTPIGIWEQAVAQARDAGDDPYEFSFLSQSGRLAPNAVGHRGPDTVEVQFFGSPLLARLDERGEIEGLSGRETTLKVEVRRAEVPMDVQALAAEYAARDARGEGFGIASPTDTVRVASGGAAFEIVYSRPAKRGREIWGGLVPWNRVWRTGANAATQFTTDRDLRIGEAEVPAGAYTLWTTFTPDSATLIINSQTGIWGTAYDAAHDLVRVPLETEALDAPVERFTMGVRPLEAGGVLELSWDRTRFSVPLRVQ